MVKIRFLNVGHGDCTIIEHASRNLTMIDINNGRDMDGTTAGEVLHELRTGSPLANLELAAAARLRQPRYPILNRYGYTVGLTNPVEFMMTRYAGWRIFRYIQSHPDLDHMRGLNALKAAGIEIINFWDTDHERDPDFESTEDEANWNEYQRLRGGLVGATVLHNYRDYEGPYWNRNWDGSAGGDGLYILAPTRDLQVAAQTTSEPNKVSYVLMLAHRGFRVVFGGDADDEVWSSVLRCYGSQLKCNVLKASHHGRESGFHAEAVNAMTPEYVICSVGKKPETDASNKYRAVSANVLSTRWLGDIELVIDDFGHGQVYTERPRR